jgi:hypothetical protein
MNKIRKSMKKSTKNKRKSMKKSTKNKRKSMKKSTKNKRKSIRKRDRDGVTVTFEGEDFDDPYNAEKFISDPKILIEYYRAVSNQLKGQRKKNQQKIFELLNKIGSPPP